MHVLRLFLLLMTPFYLGERPLLPDLCLGRELSTHAVSFQDKDTRLPTKLKLHHPNRHWRSPPNCAPLLVLMSILNCSLPVRLPRVHERVLL